MCLPVKNVTIINNEWEDNEYPLAYLITIRTFGSWLHGDERGSVDRHGRNIYGTARIASDPKFTARMLANIPNPEFLLNGPQRSCVENSIRRVYSFRGYNLQAINVRTNHVHAVISAALKPESLINAFKANATRELRENGLVNIEITVWSRGGSRRYLCKPNNVDAAIDYVVNGQGDDLPNF